MGKFGSERHEEILNRVRGNIDIVAGAAGWQVIQDYCLIADEYLMLWTLGELGVGTGKRKVGSRIPDLVLLIDEEPIVIEIGKYNPDKWKTNEFSVIHIGFDGYVTPIYGGFWNSGSDERLVVDFLAGWVEECVNFIN